MEGYKETNNKISYQEIDWDYITMMAGRMNQNKVKYGKDNYKLPMDIDLLKDALLRHVIAAMQPKANDEDSFEDHLAAIGCNCMIINYQLKHNESKNENR